MCLCLSVLRCLRSTSSWSPGACQWEVCWIRASQKRVQTSQFSQALHKPLGALQGLLGEALGLSSWESLGDILNLATSLSQENRVSGTENQALDVSCFPRFCGLSVSSQNSYIEIFTPKTKVLESGAFGRWLGHKGCTLMNGISVLKYKRWPESSLSAFTKGEHIEKPSSMDQPVGPFQTLNLPASRTISNTFMLLRSSPVYVILL